MKSIITAIVSLLFVLTMTILSFADSTNNSKETVKNAAEAGSHASKSAAHAIAGSGQVTSAASAVPLSAAGASGAASAQTAQDLNNAATSPGPLKITEETVTARPPPDQALKIKKTTE